LPSSRPPTDRAFSPDFCVRSRPLPDSNITSVCRFFGASATARIRWSDEAFADGRQLGMAMDADTIVRVVKRGAPSSDGDETLRVVGIDDCAWDKVQQHFGTIRNPHGRESAYATSWRRWGKDRSRPLSPC